MLITATQFKLARARKSLEKAHLSKDWCELKRCDGDLADCLNAAFEDGSRDAKVLVNELEYILAVYARIINDLPEDVVKNMPDIQLTTRGID